MYDTQKGREIHGKATNGEWHDSGGYGDLVWCRNEKSDEIYVADMRGYGYFTRVEGLNDEQANAQMESNAAFIVAAHNDWPAIMDELDAKTAENAALRARLEAAVEELRNYPGIVPCHACKHLKVNYHGKVPEHCKLGTQDCFEWRGPTARKDEV
jgi:hypothetical protein